MLLLVKKKKKKNYNCFAVRINIFKILGFSQGGIVIWDIKLDKVLFVLCAFHSTNPITVLKTLDCGQPKSTCLLLSGCENGQLTIWQIADTDTDTENNFEKTLRVGRFCLEDFENPRIHDSIKSLHFDKTKMCLVSSGSDRSALVWNLSKYADRLSSSLSPLPFVTSDTTIKKSSVVNASVGDLVSRINNLPTNPISTRKTNYYLIYLFFHI